MDGSPGPVDHRAALRVVIRSLAALAVIAVSVPVIAWCGRWIYADWQDRTHPYETVAGPIDWEAEPEQRPVPDDLPLVEIDQGRLRYGLKPLFAYRLNGEVMAIDTYGALQYEGMDLLAPVDLTVAWGWVPSPKLRQYIYYSHGERFVSYGLVDAAPLELKQNFAYCITHISNNHCIPADENIRYALSRVAVGDTVSIGGYLAKVYSGTRDGQLAYAPWTSSTARNDYGGTGCEIIYVTDLRINDRRYRAPDPVAR